MTSNFFLQGKIKSHLSPHFTDHIWVIKTFLYLIRLIKNLQTHEALSKKYSQNKRRKIAH